MQNEEPLQPSRAAKPQQGEAPLLPNMYQDWFLDYASYVILERAVPHLGDGLKPVQRRILHTMKRMDDGRYNKVANIVGETMKFHPTATPPSRMLSCSSARRICSSTVRETGVTF